MWHLFIKSYDPYLASALEEFIEPENFSPMAYVTCNFRDICSTIQVCILIYIIICLQGAKKINIGSTLCKIHTMDGVQYNIERYKCQEQLTDYYIVDMCAVVFEEILLK